MTVRIPMVLVLVAACAGDDRGRRPGGPRADTATGAALSAAELEVRLPRGIVERAAFVGASHLLVQIEDEGAYLYRRAGGNRVALDVSAAAGRWRPQVTWSSPMSSDRVAVYDFQNRNLTVFDTGGRALRTTSLAAPRATPAPAAVFADGGLLVLRDYMPNPYAQQTGTYADTTVLLPITADAEARGPEIPTTMGMRHGALADERPGDAVRAARTVGAVDEGVFDGRGRYSVEMPLSPRTHVAAGNDGAFLGSSDGTEIRVPAPDGTERGRFRIEGGIRPVDAVMQARLREDLTHDLEPHFRELHERLPIPKRTPHYERLLADDAGRLWVQRYSLPGDATTVWTVYAEDGALAGRLMLPGGVRLLDATSRHLLVARPGVLGSTRLRVVPYSLP